MANSIQPLQGSIPFPPSAQVVRPDTAAALAFDDAVAALPAIPQGADTAAKVVNTAASEQPVAAVPAPETAAPETLPTDVIMPFLHAPQIIAGDRAMFAVISPENCSDADGQGGGPDPDAGKDSAELPSLPDAALNGLPFPFHALQPTDSKQHLAAAFPATTAGAAAAISVVTKTPSSALLVARDAPDGAVERRNPPLQFIAALVTPAAVDPPLSGNLPDITPPMQQERGPNGIATGARGPAPLPNALTPTAETPPLLQMAAPGPVERGPMAALFAAVPQLAPRLIQVPVTGKGSLAAVDVQPKAQVLPALAPTVATPVPTQNAPAPEGLPAPDPALLTTRPPSDHLELFTPDPGLAQLPGGNAALYAPTAAGMSDRSLPTSTQPVPVADLPQIVARLAGSENTQAVGLQLDPVELGTVAFNMDTGAAGLVVTITAERPETLDLLRRHADQFLADLRQSGFQGASLQFSQSGNGQMGQGQPGQGQPGHGQFGQGNGGNPQPQGHANPDYGTSTPLFEKQPNAARPGLAGTLNLRL